MFSVNRLFETRAFSPKYGPVARHGPQRHGLTIVELLVATALASMLLMTAMELLRIVVAKRKLLMDDRTFASWHQSLEEQLRWDLANALRMEFTPQSLRLVGYAARDFGTRVVTHRRSEVLYRLARVGEKTWLLREETQPDMNSNRNRRREIVCCGLTSLALEIPGQEVDRRYSGFVPEQFHLTLGRDTSSPPVVDIYCCR